MKFQKGDVVIGNEKARCYRVTGEGFIGRVTEVIEDSNKCWFIVLNGQWGVDPERFDLYESNPISSKIEEEFEDLIFG